MGIWVHASVRYGRVFARKEFLSALKGVYESKYGPVKKKPQKNSDVKSESVCIRNGWTHRGEQKDPEEQFLDDTGLDMEELVSKAFTWKPYECAATKTRNLTAEEFGLDGDELVCVYLTNRGHSIGGKRQDFEIVEDEVFKVSDEDVEYLDKELASVGLKKEGSGWMINCSISE